MCTSIEDIDWSKMPEGTTKFSLENNLYSFSWYNEDGQFWVSGITGWTKDSCPDNRTKYKVADYHPSMQQKEQKFVPVIGQPCTAVIRTILGDLTTVVTPLYIGPKLVVLETSGEHDSCPVDHVKFFPLDDKYSDWVKAALLIVQEKIQGPTTVMDRTVLTTAYTAMKEGRLNVPSF